jgi:hypothetical protein
VSSAIAKATCRYGAINRASSINGPSFQSSRDSAATGRVVRRIADERLRVYDEPWLPPRTKDVACVQVRREQHVCGRTLRQVLEEAQTLRPSASTTTAMWSACTTTGRTTPTASSCRAAE